MKKSKAFYPCCDTFGGICHVSSFYPYMYFDTISKKIQGLVFQFPFVGSGIALVLCWSSLNQYTSGKALSYYLYGNWKGEEERFSVSRNVYGSTSIGDTRKLCIKHSILGLEYYTIHE